MKKTILTLVVLCNFALSLAGSIPQEIAIQVARNFVIEKSGYKDNTAIKISLLQTLENENEPVLYIFDVNETGFVIVSTSKIAHPILAFSFDHTFEMNPALESWLQGYSKQIIEHEKKGTIAPEKNKNAWNHYTANVFQPNESKAVVVGPLITTRWNQSKFYNTYCPWDINAGAFYDNRVPNGCVALACSQLMNYYRHPQVGVGGASYIPYPYPRQTVYFNQHTYYWDAMTNAPMNYTNEIAKLVYHVGVSCQMGYNADGSGAYTPVAVQKMVTHFGYSTDNRTTGPAEYANEPEVYVAILKAELDSLRPLLYSGQSAGGGHAFLSDGYRDDNYFHFNWGWGGSGDGYFIHDQITFNQDVKVVKKLYPATNYPNLCADQKRQTASVGYITDGSTNKPYQVNPDCSWMIAVPGASTYSFVFDRLSVYPDVDFVTIYNGPTVESGVAATFTGTTTPTTTTTINADSVLITFTTTNGSKPTHQYQGFLISYSTNQQVAYCNANTNLFTQVHHTISDGSGDEINYKPGSTCSWNIKPSFVTGFAFVFPKFELGLGDFVDVYDATSTTPIFWKRFDVYNMPNFSIVNNAPFSKIKVTFVSDNFMQKEGFALEYYAIVGVDDQSQLNDLNFYPNPASDFVTLSFDTESAENILCKIMDMTGKTVYQNNFNHNGGKFSETISVSSYAKGIYFIQLETKTGKAGGKLIIN